MPLVRGTDRIRLPAFVISDSQGLLPAFSHLAGGFEVSPSVHDRVFVVGKQEVYEVQKRRASSQPKRSGARDEQEYYHPGTML